MCHGTDSNDLLGPNGRSSRTSERKLERLRIAVAPVGWDTNFTWLNPRSGNLDKRPALEFLVGIDRRTGAYIPELAEKWEMAPDGKSWTITLRQGVKFHDNWGEFTAKDVRHSLFPSPSPSSTDRLWPVAHLLGIDKADTIEAVAQKVTQMVQIVNDYQVIIHTTITAPELVDNLSANTDLVMESKARWDAGGKDSTARKWSGRAPSSSWSGWACMSCINGWKTTGGRPGVQGIRVPLGAGGCHPPGDPADRRGPHLDVDRPPEGCVAKGMEMSPVPCLQPGRLVLCGLYFASPDKLDPKVPFVDKRVRQAMNMAINRQAIADKLLLGRAQPARVATYHPELDSTLWPEIWNADWDKRFEELYGYNPAKAKALLDQAGYPNGF